MSRIIQIEVEDEAEVEDDHCYYTIINVEAFERFFY